MQLDHCQASHTCAGGTTGLCQSVQGHSGRHLCRSCLAFFESGVRGAHEEYLQVKGSTGVPPGPFQSLKELTLRSQNYGSSALRSVNPRAFGSENRAPTPDFRFAGIWNSQAQTTYGILYTQLILDETLRFSQQAVMNHLMTLDIGAYQIGDGFLHFVVEDHEPKKYNDQDMTWVKSFTCFFTVVNDNTMIFEDRIMQSRWTVYRG